MKDTDQIPKTDFCGSLTRYKGQFGWPLFGEIKPFLPDYYWGCKADWATWDEDNKKTVLIRWLDYKELVEWQEKECKQLAESQARFQVEEKARLEREESERLARVAKQADKQAAREHGKQIVAMQTECSARKQVDALIEQANEYVLCAGKLVTVLRRIPAERLHEVDLDSFLFNCGRITKIQNNP